VNCVGGTAEGDSTDTGRPRPKLAETAARVLPYEITPYDLGPGASRPHGARDLPSAVTGQEPDVDLFVSLNNPPDGLG
jgi:hypothetical protein